MKKIALSLAIVASLALSACDKQTDTPAQTNEPAPKKSDIVTADSIDANSPTIKIWTAGMKLGATLMLLETYPKMSESQQACLLSDDADKAYFDNSRREMIGILGIDGIKKADEFYTSEVGKKIAQYSQEQMAIAAGAKVENPIKLTAEDEVKRKDFLTSAIMVKMQENIANISPEKMEADLKTIADSEAVRCKLGETTQKTDTTDQKTNKK